MTYQWFTCFLHRGNTRLWWAKLSENACRRNSLNVTRTTVFVVFLLYGCCQLLALTCVLCRVGSRPAFLRPRPWFLMLELSSESSCLVLKDLVLGLLIEWLTEMLQWHSAVWLDVGWLAGLPIGEVGPRLWPSSHVSDCCGTNYEGYARLLYESQPATHGNLWHERDHRLAGLQWTLEKKT